MGEGFKKQKRKFWRNAILKCVVCGLSFGLFVFAVVFAALKLAGIPLGALYYALIAIGSALLCAGLCILFFKPNDKKVAKELDKRHDLDEKVQTSLVYANAEGAVAELLREDTEERLVNLPKEKFDFKRVWQFFLTAVLAIAVFLSAFFVPSNIAEGETGNGGGGGGGGPTADAAYQFSDEELTELLALVEDVKASNLSAEIKEKTQDSINKLIRNLDFAETVSERDEFVQSTVKSIENTIKGTLSFKALSNSLGRNYVGPLAQMIADGVQAVYTDYVIIDYENVEQFNAEKEDVITAIIADNLDKFFDALMKNGQASASKSRAAGDDEGEAGDPSDGQEPEVSFVVKTYTNIYIALTYSDVGAGDDLYKALYALASGMENSGDVLNNTVALIFEIAFKRALAAQAYMLAMDKYVANAVRGTFSMEIPSDDVFSPNISEEPDGDRENPGDIQGGYGNGDMLYGSDDLVYDPIQDRYVTYGEIFNDYYAIVEEMVREGNLTKEQQDVIYAYLEFLFSGLEEEA